MLSLREGFDMSTPIADYADCMAELERSNINERQIADIKRAKAERKALGREKVINDEDVAQWRQENSASIKATAERFEISPASLKRACRTAKEKPKEL